MALDACVRVILCGLSASVLGALQDIIATQRLVIQGEITAVQAQLVILDITTLPLEAARGFANEVLDQARSAAALVPLGLISGCTDLGDFNVGLTASLDQISGQFNDIIDDLNLVLSFKNELNALLTELSDLVAQFTAIELVIQQCAQSA